MTVPSVKLLLLSVAIQLVLFAALAVSLPYWFDRVQQTLGPFTHPATVAGKPAELGVKDLIRAVKHELYQAELERFEVRDGVAKEKELPLFKVESFDLEIRFFVRQRASAGVSAEPQFVVVDTETEISAERTQTIQLHMTVDADPKRVTASGSTAPLTGGNSPKTVTPHPPVRRGE